VFQKHTPSSSLSEIYLWHSQRVFTVFLCCLPRLSAARKTCNGREVNMETKMIQRAVKFSCYLLLVLFLGVLTACGAVSNVESPNNYRNSDGSLSISGQATGDIGEKDQFDVSVLDPNSGSKQVFIKIGGVNIEKNGEFELNLDANLADSLLYDYVEGKPNGIFCKDSQVTTQQFKIMAINGSLNLHKDESRSIGRFGQDGRSFVGTKVPIQLSTFIYVDQDLNVKGSCIIDLFTEDDDIPFTHDLSLKKGWNLILLEWEASGMTMTMTDANSIPWEFYLDPQ